MQSVKPPVDAPISAQTLPSLLLERGAGIERYALRNAGEALPAQGSTAQLRHVLGLDAEGMAQAVREVLK